MIWSGRQTAGSWGTRLVERDIRQNSMRLELHGDSVRFWRAASRDYDNGKHSKAGNSKGC
jgi:hypothetical protein